jgi:ABC-2 type transport system permease protein
MSRKEARQILRDKHALYLALGIPVALMVLFGYALSLDVTDIPMAVWDRDGTPLSRELRDQLTSSGYFRLTASVDSYREITDAIDAGRITVGLVIPHDFGRRVKAGKPTVIQALVDGSDSTRANISMSYVETVTATFESDFQKSAFVWQAVNRRVNIPLEPRIRILFNPELVSRNNIIPGLIAIIMMVVAALLTSLTVVRERETGTLEQLISTPLKPRELIVGKLIPYFVMGYIDLMMVYLMGRYVFQVPFRGSLLLMFFTAGVFLAGAMAQGFLVSVVATNQFFATQMGLLGTFLPAFLLSGFVFPIANMPAVLQTLTHLVPARPFIAALRTIFLKGAGFTAIAVPLAILGVFALAMTALAASKLEKKL